MKRAETKRIDAFELWCWRRLLRVPWTARRSNQSILKRSVLNIHWKNWCWSWNPNTLATWCKELTHWKRPWCWEKLKAGGEEDDRGWDGWMESPTQWTWIWVGSGSGQGGLACCIPWGCKESDTTEWLNWTDWNNYTSYFLMNVVDTFILINFQTINQCCVSGINTKINKINPILFKACVCAL